MTKKSSDVLWRVSVIADNLINGEAFDDQIESLLEISSIIEERKATEDVLRRLTREIHS